MYNLQWISLFLTWQLTFSALIRVVGKFDTSCVEKHGIQQRRPSIPISPCEIDSRGARGENSKMVLIPKKKKKKKKKNPRTKDGGPIYPRVDLRATRKPQSLEAPTNFSVLLHVSNNLLFHVFTVRFESEHISRPKPFTNLRNVKNLINFSILSLTTMPGELLPKLLFIYKRKIATFPSSVVKCCTFHFHTRT